MRHLGNHTPPAQVALVKNSHWLVFVIVSYINLFSIQARSGQSIKTIPSARQKPARTPRQWGEGVEEEEEEEEEREGGERSQNEKGMKGRGNEKTAGGNDTRQAAIQGANMAPIGKPCACACVCAGRLPNICKALLSEGIFLNLGGL